MLQEVFTADYTYRNRIRIRQTFLDVRDQVLSAVGRLRYEVAARRLAVTDISRYRAAIATEWWVCQGAPRFASEHPGSRWPETK